LSYNKKYKKEKIISWVLSKLFEIIKENYPDDGKNNFWAEWYPNENKITFSYLGYRYMIVLSKIEQ